MTEYTEYNETPIFLTEQDIKDKLSISVNYSNRWDSNAQLQLLWEDEVISEWEVRP